MGFWVFPYFQALLLAFSLLTPALAAGDDPTGAEARSRKLQAEWSAQLLEIEQLVASLKKDLKDAGVEFDTTDLDRTWNKVGPQAKLPDRPMIVVLIGQHNAGKSTVANLLIGATGKDRVTEVSDEGGSTKIPVALVASDFPEKNLPLLFGGFQLKKLTRASDATAKVPPGEIQLLWSKHKFVPSSISIVDTPDVDSWHRENNLQTKAVIDVSDVVAVMVTDQYKNHDVMEALAEVAKAKKPVILIFNKANLKAHTKQWPKRVEFLQKTLGIQILDCFVVEDNPEVAEVGGELDLYSIGSTGREVPQKKVPLQAIHDLNVTELRIQTEWGALEHALGAETGLDAFVREVAATHTALSKLSALFVDKSKAEPSFADWPGMPAGIVGQAILETWAASHRSWTTKAIRVLPYYFKKGAGAAMKLMYQGKVAAAEKAYREKEFEFLRDHVVQVVLTELKSLRDSGKIRGKLASVVDTILDPVLISQMQANLQRTHDNLKLVDAELTGSIKKELKRLKDENPTVYSWMQTADTVFSGVEFLAPVAMGITASQLLAGPLASTFLTQLVAAPAQTGAMVATWSAATPTTAAAGDKARGLILRQPLENIVRQYGNARIKWTMDWLRANFLKDFYDELQKTSVATGSSDVTALQSSIDCMRALVSRVIGTSKK